MKKTEEIAQPTSGRKSKGFSDEERAAMKERAQEVKTETGRGARSKKDKAAEDENDALAKIAEMEEPDRTMATRLHEIIKVTVPELAPKTWYGMPAYAKDGKIICFFQPAQKFNTRYSTFGFNEAAHLDDGGMWPVAFALTQLTAAEEAKIKELVKKAVN